jgi:hypothetical protein
MIHETSEMKIQRPRESSPFLCLGLIKNGLMCRNVIGKRLGYNGHRQWEAWQGLSVHIFLGLCVAFLPSQ